jgi:hypothetical protein
MKHLYSVQLFTYLFVSTHRYLIGYNTFLGQIRKQFYQNFSEKTSNLREHAHKAEKNAQQIFIRGLFPRIFPPNL